MKYRAQNTRLLTHDELLSILCKSAKLYSEYVDTTLLFIFREKKADAYDFYEVRFGKNNFMHLAGIKSETLSAIEFYDACIDGTISKKRLYSTKKCQYNVFKSGNHGADAGFTK